MQKKPIRIGCVVGARPNFMKMAPILRCLEAYQDVETFLIHTGQHYTANLSDVFFEELGIRRPDICLDVGSASHGAQTGRMLEKLEAVMLEQNFDRLIVVGDVNSTLAATLAAAKLRVFVAHVEAGLRSFDRDMPEEINRIATDSLCDLLLASEPAGVANLLREGRREDDIKLVGNVMIDTLYRMLPQARRRGMPQSLGLEPGGYGLVTLHRPSNVDDRDILEALLSTLSDVASESPLVFPMHPRTRARVESFGLEKTLEASGRISVLPPLGYLDFLCLSSQARFVVTDSGGLQEETTALGVPCLTTRDNTERPITVEMGTNTLIGNDSDALRRLLSDILAGTYKSGKCPDNWDGNAAERIAECVVNAKQSALAMV